jgi:hypothetical protein
MNKFAIGFSLALLCAPFAVVGAETSASTSKGDVADAWSEGGLQKVTVKGLDVVYAKPGASLGGYSKFLLGPISVAFHRDWEKQTMAVSKMRISAADSQRIKDRLATAVREEVVKQLGEGGYQLVDTAGDDVLEVNMAIVNLKVNAPDVPAAGRANTYALSAGEMTLVAELRDSSSGDIIARVFDRTLARESFRAQRITSADNEVEARAAAAGWAKALRSELDLAKGIGAK